MAQKTTQKTLVRSAILVSIEALFCLGLIAMIAFVISKEGSASALYINSLMFGGFATVLLSLLIISVLVCMRCTDKSDSVDLHGTKPIIVTPKPSGLAEVVIDSKKTGFGSDAPGQGQITKIIVETDTTTKYSDTKSKLSNNIFDKSLRCMIPKIIPGLKFDPSLNNDESSSSTGTPETVITNLNERDSASIITKTRRSMRSSINSLDSVKFNLPIKHTVFDVEENQPKEKSFKEMMRTPTEEEVQKEYVRYLNTQANLNSLKKDLSLICNDLGQININSNQARQQNLGIGPGFEIKHTLSNVSSNNSCRVNRAESSVCEDSYLTLVSNDNTGTLGKRSIGLNSFKGSLKSPTSPNSLNNCSIYEYLPPKGSNPSVKGQGRSIKPRFSNSIYEGSQIKVLGQPNNIPISPKGTGSNTLKSNSSCGKNNFYESQKPEQQYNRLVSAVPNTGSINSSNHVRLAQHSKAGSSRPVSGNKLYTISAHNQTSQNQINTKENTLSQDDSNNTSSTTQNPFSLQKIFRSSKKASKKDKEDSNNTPISSSGNPQKVERNSSFLTVATYGDNTINRGGSRKSKVYTELGNGHQVTNPNLVFNFEKILPGSSRDGFKNRTLNASTLDKRDSLKEHHERMVTLQYNVPQRMESMRSSKYSASESIAMTN